MEQLHVRHFIMPRLPIECFEAIADHVNCPAALFALLSVNRSWLYIAATRLYRDPLNWIALTKDPKRGLELFVYGIFASTSPPPSLPLAGAAVGDQKEHQQHQGEQATATAIATTDVLQILQTHPLVMATPPFRTIDYLGLIRRWVSPPSIQNELRKLLETSPLPTFLVQSLQIPLEEAMAQIESSLVWAVAVRHPTARLEAITIVAWDMDRWCDEGPEMDPLRYDNLAHVQEIVLDFNYCREDYWASQLTSITTQFRQSIRFVRQLIAAHDTVGKSESDDGDDRPRHHPLKQVEIIHADSPRRFAAIHDMEYELFSMLPPPPPPTTINDINWRRIMTKLDQVDLSAVTKLEFLGYCARPISHGFGNESSGTGLWPIRQSQLLRQCRSLQELHTRVWEGDLFGWALEERREWQMTYGSSSSDENIMDTVESNVPRPVNLRKANLIIDENLMQEVVQSTMIAFGHSLQQAVFSFRLVQEEELDVLSIGQDWPQMLHIQTLLISSTCGIDLDRHALAAAPNLQSLKMFDLSTNYGEPGAEWLTYLDPWQFPNLEDLVLRGRTAAAFHPSSFASMQQIKTVCLVSSGNDRRFPGLPPPMSEQSTGSPLAGANSSWTSQRAIVWRWDWDFPFLTLLSLCGDPAFYFKFEVLRHSPVLQSIYLDIGGRRRPLFLPLIPSTSALSDSPASTIAPTTLPVSDSVESLDLVGAWQLSGTTSLDQLFTMCPKLKRIELLRVRGISPADIVSACQQHRHRLSALERVVSSRFLSERTRRMLGLQRVSGANARPSPSCPVFRFEPFKYRLSSENNMSIT